MIPGSSSAVFAICESPSQEISAQPRWVTARISVLGSSAEMQEIRDARDQLSCLNGPGQMHVTARKQRTLPNLGARISRDSFGRQGTRTVVVQLPHPLRRVIQPAFSLTTGQFLHPAQSFRFRAGGALRFQEELALIPLGSPSGQGRASRIEKVRGECRSPSLVLAIRWDAGH
jgi:hypothetical protein